MRNPWWGAAGGAWVVFAMVCMSGAVFKPWAWVLWVVWLAVATAMPIVWRWIHRVKEEEDQGMVMDRRQAGAFSKEDEAPTEEERTKPLDRVYLDELQNKGCKHPGCKDPNCGKKGLFLGGSCHPQNDVRVFYGNGVLTLLCAECDQVITQIAVKEGDAGV